MIEAAIYKIFARRFRDRSYYVDLLELMHEVERGVCLNLQLLFALYGYPPHTAHCVVVIDEPLLYSAGFLSFTILVIFTTDHSPNRVGPNA